MNVHFVRTFYFNVQQEANLAISLPITLTSHDASALTFGSHPLVKIS
jgi:hypothetical protein